MNAANELLEMINHKFPRHADRIKRLYAESPDFRSLCNDYSKCMQSLQKAVEKSQENSMAVKEYNQVLGDLEKELYDFIFY